MSSFEDNSKTDSSPGTSIVSLVDGSLSKNLNHAKCILKRVSRVSNENLYDHLADIIKRVIAENPPDVVDFFEEYSRNIRREKYIKDVKVPLRESSVLPEMTLVKQMEELLKVIQVEEFRKQKIPLTPPPDDFMQLQHIAKLAGVAMTKQEDVFIRILCEKIKRSEGFKACKFWGKMFGLKRNYYVFECEGDLSDKGGEKIEEIKPKEENVYSQIVKSFELIKQIGELSQFPEHLLEEFKNAEVLPPPVSTQIAGPNQKEHKESIVDGANDRTYFVVNLKQTLSWKKLRPITFEQLRVSRKLKNFLTGNLDLNIISCPVFQGTEMDYLHSLVARISAATHVAPVGYFEMSTQTGDKSDESYDSLKVSDPVPVLRVAPDFQTLLLEDQLNHKSWVHIRRKNIFRIPAERQDKMQSTDTSESSDTESEEESGKPLLSPISEDTVSNGTSWKIQATCERINTPVVRLRSHEWPGASTTSCYQYFNNLYFGWGNHRESLNSAPMAIPQIQTEFKARGDMQEQFEPQQEKFEDQGSLTQERLENLPSDQATTEDESSSTTESEIL